MDDIAVYQDKPLSIAAVKEQINLIQQLMKDVMREHEHFGVIPGCKNPSLLKAGAEKILFIFHLTADVTGDDVPYDLGNGHREYRIKCKLFNSRGELRGVGVGSCSTMETKFRYRTGPVELTDMVIPKEYWDLRKSDPGKAQEIIGKGHVARKNESGIWVAAIQGERVEHDNPADYYNTCLKMAHKRAMVSATLATTAASDICTQDVEDMVENGEKFGHTGDKAIKEPQKKEVHTDKISEAQAKRFYAIAKGQGHLDVGIKDYLKQVYKIESTKDILKADYDAACKWAETKKDTLKADYEDAIKWAESKIREPGDET